MTFAEFLSHYQIKDESLKKVRRRLVLVGRFNQSARGDNPDKFLFTNRDIKKLSPTYKNIFTKKVSPTEDKVNIYKLDYKSFVEALRPALVETEEWDPAWPQATQIPQIRTKIPRTDEAAREGTVIVDLFHFLFLRAIATTDIESLRRLEPNLQLVLQNVGSLHPGKSIFSLIREKLKDFATFQPRTYLIIDAFSKLLSVSARQNDMPPYAHGDALPAGFSEKLIDFVYLEDYASKFSVDGIDLGTPPWTQLQNSEGDSRKMFTKVVCAFRDRLLNLDSRQYGLDEFNHISLDDQAEECINSYDNKKLAGDFRKARNAFNSLHQIVRDKALLSLVLDWLIQSYFELDEVPKGLSDSDRDEFIANRILRTGEAKNVRSTQIAEPVVRATQEERDKFSSSLTTNLDLLVTLALESDDTFDSSVARIFPPINGTDNPLARAARKLRDKKTVVAALADITKSVAGADTRKAFVDAAKIALLTIVCPILYELPILTEIDIRDILNLETQRAYLTAILMSQSNKQAIAGFGRRMASFFKGKIDKDTRAIKDSIGIQEELLVDYIEMLASGDIKDQLKQGRRQLEAADTILRNLPAGGAGDISPIRPDPRALGAEEKNSPGLRAAQKTELKPTKAVVAVGQVVRKFIMADPRIKSAMKEADHGQTASTDDAGEPTTSASTGAKNKERPNGTSDSNSSKSSDQGKSTDEPGGSYLLAAAKPAAAAVLSKFFSAGDQAKESLSTKVIDELAGEAAQTVTSNGSVMDRVRDDLKAYQQILYLIYQRYVENVEKPEMVDFTNPIDRMTLANILLLYPNEMRLGSATSNLHALLIDMVEHVDREGSNIKNFIKQVSLTRYFDQAKIEKNGAVCGLTNLRNTLHAQAVANLRDTKAFVSELWGIRYLMEHVRESTEPAEIILFNATAPEFLKWLRKHNLEQLSDGYFRADKLVSIGDQAEESILPGLVFLTDSAFGEEGKGYSKDTFLEDLANFSRGDNPHRLLLPPMCISTRGYEDSKWREEGTRWAELASAAAAPVFVVGPSPLLNSKDDYFRTSLSAGYLFAAHFLKNSNQKVAIRNLAGRPMERLRVVGYGNTEISRTLERVLWPTGDSDHYGFAADYYLFIILAIRFAAEPADQTAAPRDVLEYYLNFFRPPAGAGQTRWRTAADLLSHFLLRPEAKQGRCFSWFEAPTAFPWLADGLKLAEPGLDSIADKPNENPVQIRDVRWFNLIRERMGIDGWATVSNVADEATAARKGR